MKQLILIRHGESVWNQENRFTGWVDVGLSEKGLQEAKNAGLALKKAGFSFDFDGRRVLYVKRTCHGRRVTRRSVSSFHKAAEPPRCVLRR